MRILQINKFFHVCDGTSRYFFNLSDLLSEKGHKVIHFSMHDERNRKSEFSDFFVSNISFRDKFYNTPFKKAFRMFYSLEASKNIGQLLDSFQVDIVHIHSIYHHLSCSILHEIKKRCIPIVMTVHDYHLISPNNLLFHDGVICEVSKQDRYYKSLIHKCVKNSYIASFAEILEKYLNKFRILMSEKDYVDKFICPSEFVRNKLIEYGFDDKRLLTIPHFIKSTDICSSQRSNYILFSGGLFEHKGIMILLQALKMLPRIRCIIAGEGPKKDEYLKYINENRMNNVTLKGYVSDEDLNELIRHSKFVVFPSLWYEGFGMVLAEAFVNSKPVVASDIGAASELISDKYNGLLFRPGDSSDLRWKIKTLYQSDIKIAEMGSNARNFALSTLNSEAHYEKIYKLYISLMKK